MREGDEVLLQGFTCVAVPNAVVWNGLKPVFVDVDDHYNLVDDLESYIGPNTKAIIVQHTFGIAANMKAIALAAKKHNLFIIEDCAHALGGMYASQPLGSFGDVSIVSFGRDKVVSSVFGGAALTKNKTVAAALSSFEKNLEPAPWFFYLTTTTLSHNICYIFASL
ncbi:MAG: L-glutamine:2-deoxy-scyllo-inosose aminotransferase [Microgenomates bacterium OLB23]|nr:MAG: L-glutamine:2-deoxy-scyllo-inosose aminotransferase [Microgenomates bacterium OLB23]